MIFRLNFFILLKSVKDLSYTELESKFESIKPTEMSMHHFEFNHEMTMPLNGSYTIHLECINIDRSSRSTITIENTKLISVKVIGPCTAGITLWYNRLKFEDLLSQTIVSLVSNLFSTELQSYNLDQETDSFIRTMKYAPEYNVIFSLLLEDPSKQTIHWDMSSALESKFDSILFPTIRLHTSI